MNHRQRIGDNLRDQRPEPSLTGRLNKIKTMYHFEIMKTKKYTDTDRLNYLLKYISIDDVGDEKTVLGVVVPSEWIEAELTLGPYRAEMEPVKLVHDWNDNLRDIIDRSMVAHGHEVMNTHQTHTLNTILDNDYYHVRYYMDYANMYGPWKIQTGAEIQVHGANVKTQIAGPIKRMTDE